MKNLIIPKSCTFVANNNTAEGHVWTIQFDGGERATVTAVLNSNGVTTYRILEIFGFWSTVRSEIETMLAKFAEVGNWEQEK